ncbi:MAG: hypothetical protein ACYSUV_00405 [Planctomycetota bacterium]|jgi:hypothetical protein
MFQKPLKIGSGVVKQFQIGDFVDPQYTPAVVVNGRLVTVRADGITAPAADAVIPVTPAVAYVDRPPTTSVQPGIGKAWILAGMTAATKTSSKSANGCLFRLRCNPAGAVTVASSQVGMIGSGAHFDKQDIVQSVSTSLLDSPIAITITGTQAIGVSAEGSNGAHSFFLWGFEVDTEQ